MAYNYKKAIKKILEYLKLNEENINIIENTNERGFEFKYNDETIVIFVYPISCKQHARQSFFDTRDSGRKERIITWEYAKKNGFKYFCLAVNDEQEKYKKYIFSLESDEASISRVSSREATRDDNVTGTQVNIPNDFIPHKSIERIKTPKGFFITAIHKDCIFEYISFFDNRPYMSNDIKHDEYFSAAEYAKKYVNKNNINVYKNDEKYVDERMAFLEKFSPERLKSIEDDKLIEYLFYTKKKTDDSLCYWLEYKTEMYGGGKSLVANSKQWLVYQNKDSKKWFVYNKEKDKNKALKAAKEIRDFLVSGAKIISESELLDLDDYYSLEKELESLFKNYYSYAWIHKYFHILFPDKICGFHSDDWQKHILMCFQIMPKDMKYVQSGQIIMIARYCQWTYQNMWQMISRRFGEYCTDFYRLGVKPGNVNCFDEMKEGQYIGIGWTYPLGDLSKLLKGCKNKSPKIKERLKDSDKNASIQIERFFDSKASSVFVLADGETLLAFADNIGDYYYLQSEWVGHRKDANIHVCFSQEKMPSKAEGNNNTCTKINRLENLMFLHKRYYYEKDEYENRIGFYEWEKSKTNQTDSTNRSYVDYINAIKITIDRYEQSLFACSNIKYLRKQSNRQRDAGSTGKKKASAIIKYIEYLKEREAKKVIELKYEGDIGKDYSKNKIVFGAPGTGKSYEVEKERKKLLKGEYKNNFERVTFHPDYTYAQFVGSYKPYMEDGEISYKFVPGPFMRILGKSLKNINSKEETQPFVLIVEEINRANVAAVFGDVFQLLDRDENGVSEYDIEASEEIKDYLAEVFEDDDAAPESFNKIRIPSNMFIWATMNSADQGVFPMDTAFKRRWNFEYLGINNKDSQISSINIKPKGGEEFNWNKLRKSINSHLTSLGINEDKLIGPFFISKNLSEDEYNDTFKDKVLMYLFEDAAKQKRKDVFNSEIASDGQLLFSDICKYYDDNGVKVFTADISNKIK